MNLTLINQDVHHLHYQEQDDVLDLIVVILFDVVQVQLLIYHHILLEKVYLVHLIHYQLVIIQKNQLQKFLMKMMNTKNLILNILKIL
jgi:hypothetical protein